MTFTDHGRSTLDKMTKMTIADRRWEEKKERERNKLIEEDMAGAGPSKKEENNLTLEEHLNREFPKQKDEKVAFEEKPKNETREIKEVEFTVHDMRVGNIKAAEMFPIEHHRIFCCTNIYPVSEVRQGLHQPACEFAHSVTRGIASPWPKLMPHSKYDLPRLAKYIMSYEVRYQCQPLKPARYFLKDWPDKKQWVEIPQYIYDHEEKYAPFFDGDTYVKFACDDHPNYLFICRVLFHRNPKRVAEDIEDAHTFRAVRKRTRAKDDYTRFDDHGEEYVYESFGPPKGQHPVLKDYEYDGGKEGERATDIE